MVKATINSMVHSSPRRTARKTVFVFWKKAATNAIKNAGKLESHNIRFNELSAKYELPRDTVIRKCIKRTSTTTIQPTNTSRSIFFITTSFLSEELNTIYLPAVLFFSSSSTKKRTLLSECVSCIIRPTHEPTLSRVRVRLPSTSPSSHRRGTTLFGHPSPLFQSFPLRPD